MSDRLIALQGLASHIETATGRRYCAGLWIDPTLPPSLLWSALIPKLLQSREYRAPTWSWALIDGPVYFDTKDRGFDPTIMIEILGTIALPDALQHISRVPLAALQITGSLLPVILVTSAIGDREKLMKPTTPKREALGSGDSTVIGSRSPETHVEQSCQTLNMLDEFLPRRNQVGINRYRWGKLTRAD
jgi:hypothetical protein